MLERDEMGWLFARSLSGYSFARLRVSRENEDFCHGPGGKLARSMAIERNPIYF
jgi:hypothetical protein